MILLKNNHITSLDKNNKYLPLINKYRIFFIKIVDNFFNTSLFKKKLIPLIY